MPTKSLKELLTEPYDEALDPDFTNTTSTIFTDDSSDSDDEYDIDDDKDNDADSPDFIDLTEIESSTDLESDLSHDKPNNLLPSSNSTSSLTSNNSMLVLPIHKKFHSFIHKHEIPRKVFHVSIGFITLYLHCNGYKTRNVYNHVIKAVSTILFLDILRFNWPYFNKLYCSTVGFLMREKEVDAINGVIWFQIGSIITFIFNKQDVAIMSILLLSWSDTAASTIGRKFGKYSPKLARGKSLIGSIAAFFTGIIACYIFYGYICLKFPQFSVDFEYNPNENIINLNTLALLSGFIAALSEGIDIFNLDDNLTIPVLSGFFLSNVIKLGKTV